MDFDNVVPVPDSDKAFDLVYGGNTLVSFVPNNDTFKVSYKNVGLKPGTSNIVHGFLVIETTVGTVKQIATKVNSSTTDSVCRCPARCRPRQDRSEVRTSGLPEGGRTLHVHREANGYRWAGTARGKDGVKSQHLTFTFSKGAPVFSKHK